MTTPHDETPEVDALVQIIDGGSEYAPLDELLTKARNLERDRNRLRAQLAGVAEAERERCKNAVRAQLLCPADEKYDNETSEQVGEGTYANQILERALDAIDAISPALSAAPTQAVEPVAMPDDLNPNTRKLVLDFAAAMAEKLRAAEIKYGYSDFWMDDDWMDECRAKLREHLEKGDPRDVANYCAFLWYHQQPTTIPLASKYPFPSSSPQAPDEKERK